MEFLLDIVRCNSSQDRKVEEEEKKEERGEEWNFELHRAPLAAWKGKEIYAIVPGTYPRAVSRAAKDFKSNDLSFREVYTRWRWWRHALIK